MKNISPLYKFSLKRRRVGRTASTENVILCGDRACRAREMQARVRLERSARNPVRRSCVSSARNAGESAICPVRAQPSAEIVRVECAKCRRECDLSHVRATLCGDRACRVRETQTRVRFVLGAGNPLRSRACRVREMQARVRFVLAAGKPSAEIVRVERAKCRRECDLSHARATLERRSRVSSARNAVLSTRNAGESVICPVCAQPSAEIARASSARNAGESAICPMRAQPSAEIVARRARETQARVCPVCAQPSAEIARACRVREM